jgi:hypothetical protein
VTVGVKVFVKTGVKVNVGGTAVGVFVAVKVREKVVVGEAVRLEVGVDE